MATALKLLSDSDAPRYMREDSIKTGYRQRLSYGACITSWFRLHNETVNIWSHLVGTITFLYWLTLILFNPPLQNSSYIELLPLIIQLVSYIVCMLSSTLFHTFSCHSEAAHRSWRFTDHFGILFALFGTYVSLISNSFRCNPPWMQLHLIAVFLLFIWVIFVKILGCVKDAKIPLDMFILVALYSTIPITHWIWLQGGMFNGIVQAKLQQILIPFVAGAVGLVFYVTRFPEKQFQAGSVDLLGASHQVWHVLIFLGMVFWYLETSSSFVEEQSKSCPQKNGTAVHFVDFAANNIATIVIACIEFSLFNE